MTTDAEALSAFSPPLRWRNGHLQTIWPALFRRVGIGMPVRERITTPDDDFLDLDWYRADHSRLLVISHGLEGNSRRPYILGLARAASASGWDVLAWNFRSCGGELNRRPRFYHSGDSGDLDLVLRHGLRGGYSEIVLAGFSIGGNMTLVYLGTLGERLPEAVKGAAIFSAPCDLAGGAERLAEPNNRLYMHRFMRQLRRKMRQKHALFPNRISLAGLDEMRTFHDFDERYTAPLHGFENARDYWERCSGARFIDRIRTPVLIVNALDDPFLSTGCFPRSEAAANPRVVLETPNHGGHVGFMRRLGDPVYWSESRALAFFEEIV